MDGWAAGAEAMRGAVMHLIVGALGEAVAALPVLHPPGEPSALH